MRVKILVFVAAAATTMTLFINFCNLVYRCGCQSWWAGVADHCNIHAAQPPHCPWCTSALAGNSSFGVILVVQALVAFMPWRWGGLRRLALTLAAFPLAGGLMALLWGWYAGYWNAP
jgi:hypothetical protein